MLERTRRRLERGQLADRIIRLGRSAAVIHRTLDVNERDPRTVEPVLWEA